MHVMKRGRFGVLLVTAVIGLVASIPASSQAKTSGVEAAGTSLIGVSCWSPKGCIAVGDFLKTTDDSLAGRWNGHAWTHLTTPNAAGAVVSMLDDVSCNGASYCMAIGTSNFSIGVETWNGTSWKLWQPTEPPPAILTAIGCGAPDSCEVVGDRTNQHDDVVAAAYKSDGSSLDVQTMPDILGGELLGASCLSPSHCVAVGNVTEDKPTELVGTLAESFNGSSWKRLPTPNPGAAGTSKNDQLLSVSCANANNCVAVGQNDTPNSVRALAESWNGKKWKVLKTAKGTGFTLFGVSCAKVKSCIAVGMQGSGTLAEKWNGKKWRRLKTPTSTGAFLNSVSCAKPNSCLAVGTANNHATLSESWNGKKWRALKPLKG